MASLKHNKIDTVSKQAVSSPSSCFNTPMQIDDDSAMSRDSRDGVHEHEHSSGIHTPRRFNKKPRLIGESILADAQSSFEANKVDNRITETSLTPECDAPMNLQSELRACDLDSPRARGTGSLPPQPATPHVTRTGSLFEALRKNDIEEIRNVFRDNADAMNDYFWDNHFEPALCGAVHLKCKADIIRLLIDKGADTTMKDRRGRTAFDILNQARLGFEAGFHDVRTIAMNMHQFVLPPFQCEGVIGHFRYTLDLLTVDDGFALVDQREAWRREIAVLLEV